MTLIRHLADKHFSNGHTLIDAVGRWRSPLHGSISESTIIVEVWDMSPAAIGGFAREYKDAAHQESVVVLEHEVNPITY